RHHAAAHHRRSAGAREGRLDPRDRRPARADARRARRLVRLLRQGRLARRLCRGAAQGAKPGRLPAASRRIAVRETPPGQALRRERQPDGESSSTKRRRQGGYVMDKTGSSRRAVIAGALALGGAPFIRRASAQPAQGVSPALAELYEKAKPEGEVTIWAPGSPSVQWIPAEF